MVEKYDKTLDKREGDKDLSEEGKKLITLVVRSGISMGLDSALVWPNKEWKEKKSSAEYVVNWKPVRLERNILMKWDKIQKFEMSIHKLISPKRDIKLSDLLMAKIWTTYKLKVTYDEHNDNYSFLLETNDGYGNKDSRIIAKEELDDIMSSFDKRLFELQDSKREKVWEQRERMQKLAYNDEKEADADLDRALGDIA